LSEGQTLKSTTKGGTIKYKRMKEREEEGGEEKNTEVKVRSRRQKSEPFLSVFV